MDRLISATLDNVARLCEADHYDYIVIGSGIGGGVLARSLVEESCPKTCPKTCPESCSMTCSKICSKTCFKPRVLIIERGGLLLDTHCTNIASPRWNQTSLEGPSMDNAMVYDTLKDSFATVTSKSLDYAGGPVYGIGGRSLVWGLYTPMLSNNDLERFPANVQKDLNEDNYNKAYKLMTNDQGASITRPYPLNHGVSIDIVGGIESIKEKLNSSSHGEELKSSFRGGKFELCPMAAEFTARKSGSRLYQMVMGGYSTATWILNQVFNKSEYLNLLTRTQVVTINRNNQNRINSLTVLDGRGKERVILTGKATVILCAGTIDTAAVALRSGLGTMNKYVGRGLTDHDIWGTRFIFLGGRAVGLINGQALRLQRTVTMKANPGPPIDCLVNITVNAPSFLGHQRNISWPNLYIGNNNEIISEKEFLDTEAANPCIRKVMVQVVYCFPSEGLCDSPDYDSRVLNLPKPVPTIQVAKKDTSMYTNAMEKLASEIMNCLRCQNPPEQGTSTIIPRVSRAPFGVVAHEVGTMRMGEDKDQSVVDNDLKVHGLENLFVCDLSVFPTSPSSNPSITLAVLAQRLALYLKTHRP
ncbi:FAD/NAD(P)-binding domain-containing protein [Xylaria cubensis]|nr:FAD/NAD(P)-binding domain-containing protein [Xylaria cubensis]